MREMVDRAGATFGGFDLKAINDVDLLHVGPAEAGQPAQPRRHDLAGPRVQGVQR